MKNCVLCLLMGFLTIFCVLGVDLKNITSFKCGNSDDVIRYKSEYISEYIKSEYYSKYDIKSINMVESNKFLIDSCKNFDQSKLNAYYNSYHPNRNNKVEGTCAVVATLSTVEFYNKHDNNSYIDYQYAEYDTRYQREREFYSDILTYGIENNYTTRTNGTENSKMNNLLTLGYSLSGSKRHGHTEWYHIKKKLNKSLSNNVPELYAVTDHAVVVCGYTTISYTISYRKNNTLKTIEASKEGYIVNEGWGDPNRSIIFKDKIGNITDSHLLVITAKK